MQRFHRACSSGPVNSVLLNEAFQDDGSTGQRLSSRRSLCEAMGGVRVTLPVFAVVSFHSQPVMYLPDGSWIEVFVTQV